MTRTPFAHPNDLADRVLFALGFSKLARGRRKTQIFVTERQIVEQILRRADAELRKLLDGAFTDAREVREPRYFARDNSSAPISWSVTP